MKKIILTMLLVVNCLCFVNVHAIDNIVVLGLFKDKAIVELDGKRRVLTLNQVSPEGVTLISASSQEAVLEIDGEHKSYTLGKHIGGSYRKAETGVTVTVSPDEQGMYHVNGSINGFQVRFVIDTGATLISMNSPQAKRLGLQYKLDGQQALSSTASGLDKIYIVNLKKVKVGDIELTNIKGAVHDGDFPTVILLGNSFLNRVDLQRKGRILTLEKKP